MPLSTIGSYNPVIVEHLAHWEAVNADPAAPPGGLVLPGPYTIADLQADAAALGEAIDAVRAPVLTGKERTAERQQLKRAMLGRLSQFRAAVTALVPDPGFVGALPLGLDVTATESKFLAPFHAMAQLWSEIDAATGVPGFTPPLVLPGYTRADLAADIAALPEVGARIRQVATSASVVRGHRDEAMKAVKARLKQYRLAVVAVLGPEHALAQSLPRFVPRGGSTPKPVALTGSWDAEERKACLAWSASDNPRLDYYSVRACAGKEYRKRAEFVVGHVPKEQTTFATDAGLLASGAAACFRVYVVTDRQRERGSNAVTVRRGE